MKTDKMNINKMFPHIAGYTKIKEEGAQIIDILSNSEEYVKRGAHVPRGWFFYGEPGMGKTQIVKDISAYLNYPIIEISSSDAIKRKVNIREDIVNGFSKAVDLGRCIVFIDEMDKFAGYKKYFFEVTENLENQKILLHELDEIKKHDGVVVIATANKPDYLNETILRSGRFDRHVQFPKPNAKDRKEIIKFFLGEVRLDRSTDIDELVKITAGCSCADIESTVNESKISAISNRRKSISFNDFYTAFNRVKFKDIPKDANESDEQTRLIAYHEAGHALMGYRYHPESIQNVSVLPQGEGAGSVKMLGDDDSVKTKSYYEQSLRISLAGLTAVKVLTGEMTSGNTGDLSKAVETAKAMLNNGFYGFENIVISISSDRYSPTTESSEQMGKRVNAVIEILNQASKDVEEYLSGNKDLLLTIAEKLIENKTLSGKDLSNIIESYSKNN